MTTSHPVYQDRIACSLCGKQELDVVVELPPTPLANDYPTSTESAREQERYPLAVVMCRSCQHAQSSIIVEPRRLFPAYVYATATSPVTIAHLRDEARQVAAKLGLREILKPLVVEVGSNDGSFLKELRDIGLGPESLIGVDPARAMAAQANKDGIQTMNDFFNEDVAASIVKHRGLAHLVVANNVLAHVPDVLATLRAVRLLLHDDGVLVMEVAHAADVLHGAFDTIYHEHMSHHALQPLAFAFNELDMRIIDVEKPAGQVGRGSLRVYATPRQSRRWPDVATSARNVGMFIKEQEAGVLDANVWKKKIEDLVSKTELELELFIDEHDKGVVAGYGAPAKLTTLAIACCLETSAIDYVVDDSPWKQGLFTPGTGWPILDSSELIKRPPEAIIMFAWNFADDVAKKLREGGFKGPIAVPLPEWRVL